ncbi:hypothetical protein TEA_010430 [Camellia sinensis var. sinensis]|uniref:O-methyltransferase C-terminal domain-containing protein n=1 Tax=Camellia sinensis var. sinensis TaxID=542762 RepID=A0A4S4D1Y0_CAMSN|nr:hypothetical protein TEA_010430 [Camellia sinensis var. sinensis]
MVVDGDRDEHNITETKLVFDILMMVLVTGKERSEKEWEKIFLEAGFSHYKITPIFGGGTGINARIISEAFPGIKCTVFDLPHVVENLPQEKNLNYVRGDMFRSFLSADAFFFKCVLHNWSDENCVKILKRCREAIPSKEDGGKVIIIDMVVDGDRDEHDIAETKLVFDILMMVLVTGRERSEKEWEKIFLEAGFSHYKITPIFGLRCNHIDVLRDVLCDVIAVGVTISCDVIAVAAVTSYYRRTSVDGHQRLVGMFNITRKSSEYHREVVRVSPEVHRSVMNINGSRRNVQNIH